MGTVKERANEWILSGDTGTSSKTIWAVMMDSLRDNAHCRMFNYDVPHDPDDFGRCFRLLKLIPEWRERISEMGEKLKKWKPFADKWGELEMLWRKELASGACPELYARIQALEDKGRLLEGWVKAGHGSWTFKG